MSAPRPAAAASPTQGHPAPRPREPRPGGPAHAPPIAAAPRAGPVSIALRLALRVLLATVGLSIFALGVALNIQAGLGLQPWWALHYGMSERLPMTIGQANLVVGILVMVAAWLLGVKPGLATVLNVLILSVATDVVLAGGLIPKGSGGPDSYIILFAGLLALGFGTAVYVKADLGAGPRDSLMLGLAYHLRGRVGLARNAMDLAVTLIGWLMGAPIGIGTLVFSFGTGPVVAFWFKLLRVKVKRKAPLRKPPPSGGQAGARPSHPPGPIAPPPRS